MMDARAPGLTIISTAPVSPDAPEALRNEFPTIEIIELSLPRGDALSAHAAEINRAVDAAKSSWILLLRDREVVCPGLAKEIVGACLESPAAWAFRVRSVILYRGKHLVLGQRDGGSIRLFHRRHCRLVGDARHEVKVQGTVVRLEGSIEATTFSSATEHEEVLRRTGVPHSLPRRLARFIILALQSRPLRAGMNGLCYLWVEAGYDLTPPGRGVSSPPASS